MKKSKFTDAQIAFILRQAEEGTRVEEVCRKSGISQQTFYRWKKFYGGLMPSEMKRLKQLEEENGRLKRIVADLSLDREMLQDVIRRRALRSAQCWSMRRELVDDVRVIWGVSIRRACKLLRANSLDLALCVHQSDAWLT